MALGASLKFDCDDAQSGDLVNADILAQPQGVILDDLQVILVILGRGDIDSGRFGLEIGFSLGSWFREGLGGVLDEAVDVGVS